MQKVTKPLHILVVLLLAVLVVQVIFGLIVWFTIPTAQDRGLFGDMFGAINALFSGLAFAGIVYTIVLQRAEFSSNVTAGERAARLSAISSLLAAYTERVRYLDSRASPQTGKVVEFQGRIDALAQQLEADLEFSRGK